MKAVERERRSSIMLLAHAPIASAFASVAHDVGLSSPDLLPLDIPVEMSRERAFAAALGLLGERQDEPCLVLVDLGGGASPFAVAQRLHAFLGNRLRIVTGLNVAMLMTALCHRHLFIDEQARRAAQRGEDAVERFPVDAVQFSSSHWSDVSSVSAAPRGGPSA